MLTYADNPTIRNAIIKRLDKERGIGIADIQIKDHGDHIAVMVWLILTDTNNDKAIIDIRSVFELPAEFYLRHLHNEIDEIAECCKKARKQTRTRLIWQPGVEKDRQYLQGTGLRGKWKRSENVNS